MKSDVFRKGSRHDTPRSSQRSDDISASHPVPPPNCLQRSELQFDPFLKLSSDSHMEPVPAMSPRSIKRGESNTIPGIPLQTMTTHFEDVRSRLQSDVGGNGLPKGPLHRHAAVKSASQLQAPENREELDPPDDQPCLDGGLSPQVEAGLQVSLVSLRTLTSMVRTYYTTQGYPLRGCHLKYRMFGRETGHLWHIRYPTPHVYPTQCWCCHYGWCDSTHSTN